MDEVTGESFHHITVMRAEVVDYVVRPEGRVYVDCTLGGGGHAAAVLERAAQLGAAGVQLIGLDRDPAALAAAGARLVGAPGVVERVESNYGEVLGVLEARGLVGRVDGLVLDAGVSSHQLDTAARGFSFSQDGPLDMRMGATGLTAGELIDSWEEEELASALWRYGELRNSRRLASKIKAARARGELTTTLELSALCGKPRFGERLHPATLVFQALRIAVNDELASLERVVSQVAQILAPGGRCAFISFHSLEDRIVKHGLRSLAKGCTCPPSLPGCVCGKAPLLKLGHGAERPGEAELGENPRSRSARLRLAERL